MHSSQNVLLQHGVRTASRKRFEQMGQPRVLSASGLSRMSASVSPFGLVVSCFSQDALSGWATTSLPSGVIITPAPEEESGLSTTFKKLLGIPVVLFSRGFPSKSRSLFVGQS